MKISKLFHWLYAILMLLPFVFFVPSVLYYAFNDNATMQSVEVPKIETITVDFNQMVVNMDDFQPINYTKVINDVGVDLEVNLITNQNLQIYKEYILDTSHIYIARFNVLSSVNAKFYARLGQVSGNPFSVNANELTTVYTRKYADYDGRNEFNLYAIRTENNFANGDFVYVYSAELFDLTKMFGFGNEPSYNQFINMFSKEYYEYNEGEMIQITYDTGETMQLVENTSIVNYAWESIWNLPLFSWTKVTFIAVPFTYITGLFGLAASNSINYVFGYFLSISIVWLVFDVIMYVPLLCHRWIDKARIE